MKFKIIFLFSLLLIKLPTFAQINLIIEPDSLAKKEYFDLRKTFMNDYSLQQHLTNKIDSLKKNGYLASSVDSLINSEETTLVKLHLGERIEKVELRNGNIPTKVYEQLAPDDTTSWLEIEQTKNRLQDYYLNQGYLNHLISIDPIEYLANKIVLQVDVIEGSKYKFDKLVINGNASIDQDYLLQLFQLEEGAEVNLKTLNQIDRTLTNLEYLNLKSRPQFILNEFGFTDILLNLDNSKSNQFDLLVGFLPNAVQANNSNQKKTRITGEGILKLINPFGKGRSLGINYKQLQPESPILSGELFLPNILKQPFGLRSNFNLEKQDTAFLNLNFSARLDYTFHQNQHFVVGYESGSSFLQNVDTLLVKQTQELPPSTDFSQNLYLLGYQMKTLNKRLAPTSGFQVHSRISIGSKKISPNSTITNLYDNSFDYSSLYENINDDKSIIIGEVFGQYFLPVFKNSTILVQTNSAYKSLNQYFENDLYRLGGINSIRGFDERSHLASTYSINTLEYRLLLNKNSYFSVFSDLGYTRNDLSQENNFLTGLGTGLDLETKAGIFAINLAVGKSKELPFDFNRSRIHFSYVNVF